ncbi:hypothetical protein Q73_07290 [Bacillus coahuilensis m2-6]|uniref:indole-3-glycerol phosphate synthase TrpC n=1 Tax=Bacillus coahuilensis TaxID=408580 RepID=UPI0007503423|nr:indole-3-glycerol phosphate synthase TrpC [Bacillus coahuilensis]KUP08157.1 hypothetical protein Q73_07290 [Bacillus coahuilensis m2-6]
MNLLHQIIETKKKEIEAIPIVKNRQRGINNFLPRILENDFSIIAEFKRASPSKGVINEKADPIDQAKYYLENGATGMSILTDSRYFKGSFDDLSAVADNTAIPLLCKDFIIDKKQIEQAYSAGTDMILLIVAALSDRELNELFTYSKGLNLDVLIEVHNRIELDRALEISPDLIGINNRNLETFSVNLEVTEQLGPIIHKRGIPFISESGIASLDDVKRVHKAGARGILVGESLMRNRDLLREFQRGILE